MVAKKTVQRLGFRTGEYEQLAMRLVTADGTD